MLEERDRENLLERAQGTGIPYTSTMRQGRDQGLNTRPHPFGFSAGLLANPYPKSRARGGYVCIYKPAS